ncbi:MAG: MqnA/MqnD/SBP family protein, partial [Oscillospiraceae bacterium]
MKKTLSVILTLVLALGMFTACGTKPQTSSSVPTVTAQPSEEPTQMPTAAPVVGVDMKVASLKGPTTMGMVKLMRDGENKETINNYTFNMYGAADEIVPLIAKGEVDVALVPANLASVLYNKTEGKVAVAAVNTLGVLYVLENGDTIKTINDLEGKTIYTTGKGTTPDYVLNYVLKQASVNATVEFKSEATEVAAMMESGENVVAMLPQPYVTAVTMQNKNVRVALDMTKEWDKVNSESGLVTGVLLVRKEFAEQNKDAFNAFLQEYKASTEYVNTNVDEAAQMICDYGIVAKAPMAKMALPNCNITYIEGAEMKTAVSGYLNVLFTANPQSVGGKLPADDFYYG